MRGCWSVGGCPGHLRFRVFQLLLSCPKISPKSDCQTRRPFSMPTPLAPRAYFVTIKLNDGSAIKVTCINRRRMEAKALKSEMSRSDSVEGENLLRGKTNDNTKSTDAVPVNSNYTSVDSSKRSHLCWLESLLLESVSVRHISRHSQWVGPFISIPGRNKKKSIVRCAVKEIRLI